MFVGCLLSTMIILQKTNILYVTRAFRVKSRTRQRHRHRCAQQNRQEMFL